MGVCLTRSVGKVLKPGFAGSNLSGMCGCVDMWICGCFMWSVGVAQAHDASRKWPALVSIRHENLAGYR